MTRVITASLTVLLLTASPVMAADVTVGHHPLRPDQADQTIQVMVKGGEQIVGMYLNAMIGGGGEDFEGGVAGPTFKAPGPPIPPGDDYPYWAPAMLQGTIWENNYASDVRIPPHGQFFIGSVEAFPAPAQAGTVSDYAVLVNLVIDTTGFSEGEGPWALDLTGSENGDTELLETFIGGQGVDIRSITLDVTPGTIQIVTALNAISSGSWNVGDTWGGDLPTIYDMVAVDGLAINVDSGGEAFSLSIDNGGAVDVPITQNLAIDKEVTLAADATLTVDGTLTVADVFGTGTLAGSGTIEIAGHVAPGASVGTLTVTDAAVAMATSATYDAEVSLATVNAGSDLIELSGTGSLQLGGTLSVSGIGRTDSAIFGNTTRTIVNGTVIGTEFDAVVPASGTTAASHIGQGAFLRDVTYVGSPGPITAVTIDVVVALEGDVDGDGLIGLDDWDTFRANFGSSGADWTQGNFDPWSDITVDLDDWDVFRSRFGETYPVDGAASAVAAVPEPGTIVMLLGALAGLALAVWRRRRTA